MKRDDVKAFVERDWARLSDLKASYWTERFDRLGPKEALRVMGELRSTARAFGALETDREEDLRAHLRLIAILRRANAARRA